MWTEKELLNEIDYDNFWLLKYNVLLSITKRIKVGYMQNLHFTLFFSHSCGDLKINDNEPKNRFEWVTWIPIWKEERNEWQSYINKMQYRSDKKFMELQISEDS